MVIQGILVFILSGAGQYTGDSNPKSSKINEIVVIGHPDSLSGALYRGFQYGAFLGIGADICVEHGLGFSLNFYIDRMTQKSAGVNYIEGAAFRFLKGIETGSSMSATIYRGLKLSAFPNTFFRPYFQIDAGLNFYYGLDWYLEPHGRDWRIGPRVASAVGFDFILSPPHAPCRYALGLGVKGAAAGDLFHIVSMDFSLLPDIRLAITRPYIKSRSRIASAKPERHYLITLFGCFAHNKFSGFEPDGLWGGFEYRYLLFSDEWLGCSSLIGIQGHYGFDDDDQYFTRQRMYGYYAGIRLTAFVGERLRPYWETALGNNIFSRTSEYDREKFTVWLGAGGEWITPLDKIFTQVGFRFDPLEYGGLVYQVGIGYRL
jgi:hypothetical protein